MPEKIFGESDLNISLTKTAKILTLVNYLVLFFCLSLRRSRNEAKALNKQVMKSMMLESNGIRIVFSFGGKVCVNQLGREVETVNNFSTFRKWAKGVLSDSQFKVAKAQFNRM